MLGYRGSAPVIAPDNAAKVVYGNRWADPNGAGAGSSPYNSQTVRSTDYLVEAFL